MTFDEVYETLPGTGWLTKEEARLLYGVASEATGPILEVGSYYGRSAVLLASLGNDVHCVDPFDNFDSADMSGDSICDAFKRNVFYERGLKNVYLHRVRIEDFDWSYERPAFKFAYLDGDHTYQGSMNQITKALSLGIQQMCIHDYAQEGGGVNIVKAIGDSGLTVVQVVERMAHCRLR